MTPTPRAISNPTVPTLRILWLVAIAVVVGVTMAWVAATGPARGGEDSLCGERSCLAEVLSLLTSKDE